MTYAELYGPCMAVTQQAAADELFERCVAEAMTHGRTRPEAEEITRSNLGYYAGYFDSATRGRVEKLFRCAHPFFGPIADNGQPTPERAFELGVELGKKHMTR